jgi:hypothetical protein
MSAFIGMSWLLKFNQEPDEGDRVGLPNHSNATDGRFMAASCPSDLPPQI